MLSPHAAARCRSLFTMSLDADRQRRAAGLPESKREVLRSRPMDGETLLHRMQMSLQPVIQTQIYSGG